MINMIFAQAPEEPEQLQSASGGGQLIISVSRTACLPAGQEIL
jgi:hypothetical protein